MLRAFRLCAPPHQFGMLPCSNCCKQILARSGTFDGLNCETPGSGCQPDRALLPRRDLRAQKLVLSAADRSADEIRIGVCRMCGFSSAPRRTATYKSLITSLIELMLSIALRTAAAMSLLRSMKDCESIACTLTEMV